MEILKEALALQERTVQTRRRLHEIPEVSGQETETAAFLKAEIEKEGLDALEVPGGLLAYVPGKKAGPCMLMRCDMDGLPIEESSRNMNAVRTCRSRRPGVMHACGHDAHMAMQLSAMHLLLQKDLPYPLLFVFERGEEDNSGFKTLLPYIDAHYSVGFAYATHVRWDIPSGKIAVPGHIAMAGALGFEIALHGKGGHGSRPDLAHSPIDCFCAISQRLSALRMQEIDPESVLTCSIGSVHAGSAGNIIPDILTFSGTARTYDTAGAGERFALRLRQIIEMEAQSFGCRAEFLRFPKPLYETANTKEAVPIMKGAIEDALGKDSLFEAKPWMASETFGAYLRLWPGILTFTGIRNLEKGCGSSHHSAEFDVDEDALAYGTAAAVACCLMWQQDPSRYSAFTRTAEPVEELVQRSI